MLFNLVIIAIGLATLVVGANGLVRGASALALRLGVSSLVIGLTVVAFGTSAPELTVNLFSAFNDSSELAIGNVVGSNIANVLLILGITALIAPLSVQRSTIWKEIPFALLAAVLLLAMGSDTLLDQNPSGDLIGRIDGIGLWAMMAIFMYYVVTMSRNTPDEVDSEEIVPLPLISSLLWVSGGLIALVIGGQLLVDGAIALARDWQVSESVIGLTIVAVGTSLPEMATSIVAAMKKQADIAIGNIVGSNIFNIFFILGTTSLILPLGVPDNFVRDALVAISATILLFAFMFIGKKQQLRRWEGVAFITLYIAYTGTVLLQG